MYKLKKTKLNYMINIYNKDDDVIPILKLDKLNNISFL